MGCLSCKSGVCRMRSRSCSTARAQIRNFSQVQRGRKAAALIYRPRNLWRCFCGSRRLSGEDGDTAQGGAGSAWRLRADAQWRRLRRRAGVRRRRRRRMQWRHSRRTAGSGRCGLSGTAGPCRSEPCCACEGSQEGAASLLRHPHPQPDRSGKTKSGTCTTPKCCDIEIKTAASVNARHTCGARTTVHAPV